MGLDSLQVFCQPAIPKGMDVHPMKRLPIEDALLYRTRLPRRRSNVVIQQSEERHPAVVR